MTTPEEGLQRLLDAGGADAVAAAAADGAPADHPAAQRVLRERFGADGARLVLRLAEGRRKARAKFPDADRLLFTPELAEQATPHPVATRRAARMASARSWDPDGPLLDLGCGAGGDLTRCAAAGLPVVGLERDPLAAALARYNLAILGLPGLVDDGDFPQAAPPAHDALFADPARRRGDRGPRGQRRLLHAEDLRPRPADLRPLLAAAKAWAVKWGPGLDLDPAALTAPGALLAGFAPEAWSLQVTSWNGAVREAAFWGGEAAGAEPEAVVLRGPVDAAVAWTWRGDPAAPPPPRGRPRDWIHEPDGALLRAGLMNHHARARGLDLLADGIAYLTADAPAADPGTRAWRRLATLPWSRRRVRALLADLGAGEVAVKTRGVALTPERVRAGLDLRGDRALVLILHRGDDGPVAHVCLPPGEEEPRP